MQYSNDLECVHRAVFRNEFQLPLVVGLGFLDAYFSFY